MPATAYTRRRTCDVNCSCRSVGTPASYGVNFRRWPGTGYPAIGHLSSGGRFTACCGGSVRESSPHFGCVRLGKNSKSGITAGSWGWVHEHCAAVAGHHG